MPETNAAWRTSNPGYLLYTATGLGIQDKLRFMHHAGFAAITDAQLSLFHNIDPAGTRLTTIAARAGLTKQSMVELVNKAAALGLVMRRPDPCDQRAKLVLPTAQGRRLLNHLQAAIEATELHMTEICGGGFLAEIKHELLGYIAGDAAVVVGTPDDPFDQRTDIAARGNSTGRILAYAARHFAAQALTIVHRQGYHDVSEVLLSLFRNLDLDGTRLTEIAIRARMTKQSMRELVDRAELLEFVDRATDPADGRAKIIAFTPSGLAMLDHMRLGLIAAERELAAVTAPGFVARLKSGLSDYIATAQAADASRAAS